MIKKEKLAESRDQKVAAVAKWKASGLSQAEFCRREGYQQWQISEWRRWVEKYEQGQAAPPTVAKLKAQRRRKARREKCEQPQKDGPDAVSESQHFVPIHLVCADSKDTEQNQAGRFNCVVELVLKRGQTIRVAPGCSPQFLGAIVETLDR